MSTIPNQAQGSNKDFWTHLDETYHEVTTDIAWRDTIGRVSCAVRIPIYLLAAAFQAVKILVKTAVTPITYFLAWACDTKKLDSWKFEGIEKDGLMTIRLFDKIGSSAIGVLTAPPKKYYSLWEAIASSGKVTLLGSHQKFNLETLTFATFKARVCYSKIIIETDKIYSTKNWPQQYVLFEHFASGGRPPLSERIKSA